MGVNMFNSLTEDKFNYFLFAGLLLAFVSSGALIHAITILIAIVSIKNIFKNIKSVYVFKKIPVVFLIPLILFFVFGMVTSFFSIEKTKYFYLSLKEYKWILVFLLYFYYIYNNFKLEWMQAKKYVFAVVGVVTLYAIWQVFSGIELTTGKALLGAKIPYRSNGPFGIPITFSYLYGGVFFLFLPVVYNTFKSLSKPLKVFYVTSLVLAIISIFASQTRAAWVGLFFTFIPLSLIYLKKTRLIALAVILTLPVIYFTSSQKIQHRISSIVDYKATGYNKGRIDLWSAHFELFKSKPILGNGMRNYYDFVKSYYLKHDIKKTIVSHAHNTYLHILSSQGLLGFIPFLIFFLYLLYIGFLCVISTEGEYYFLSLGLLSSQVFLHFGGLTEVLVMDSEVIHFLSLIWALTIVVYIKRVKKSLNT